MVAPPQCSTRGTVGGERYALVRAAQQNITGSLACTT
jgi:hypothetical protein